MSDTILTPTKRFWLLLKPDKQEIRNLYVYAIIIGLLNLVTPIGIQSIINLIQGGTISTSWYILIFLVALAISISGIMQINQLRITENLQQKIFTRAAFEFTYRIPKIKWDLIFKKHAPELMNRFFDVISVQKGISKILIDFTSASIQVLFGLLLLCFYHPFFIIFSFLLVAILYVIFKITINRGLNTSLKESKYKYAIAHWLQEIGRSKTVFKLVGNSNLTMNKTDENVQKYIDAREQHFSILKLQYGLMVVFKVLVAVGLLLIGGLLVIDQQMNIGQFVAAEIVILLIVNSVEKLIVSFETVYDVLTSLEKIGQVTDLDTDKNKGVEKIQSDKGFSISASDVSFKYPSESTFVLKNLSFDIQSGQRTMILGKNSSGKSTLINLLAGAITPTKGKIIINDSLPKNYEYNDLRSQIGVLLREDRLFEGTILENISINRKNISFDDVKWAVESVGLTELINQQSQGYSTSILPQGKQFSNSTISKLLMARAIVSKPKLLIIESDFNLFESEYKERILEFLLDPKHNWTIIISDNSDLEISNLIDKKIEL